MILTDNQLQNLLINECVLSSDKQTEDVAVLLLPTWISMYAKKTTEQKYWYVRRSLLMFMLASCRRLIDITVGPDKVAVSQIFRQTERMLSDCQKQIDIVDPYAHAPILGQIIPKGVLPDAFEEYESILNSYYLGFYNQDFLGLLR